LIVSAGDRSLPPRMDFENQTPPVVISRDADRGGAGAGVPVIDCQWHWYPRAACQALTARRTHPLWTRHADGFRFEPSSTERWFYSADYVDLDRQLAIMDDAGIDAAVVSPVIAGDVSGLELADARETCALFNEELAAAQRAHAGRIHGLAVLPVQDAQAAVETLDDAVARLGLRGVLLHSSVAGGSIADRELWPLYARAEELGAPIFLHPTRTVAEPRVRDYALEHPLSYMFDTTIAALSLIVGGVLDAYPDLKLVHPHFGGTLPYLVDRVDVYRRMGRWKTERPVRDYLSRFYTDTVSESPGALQIALELYGVDRLLFASDFPYFPAADGVRFVREHLPAEHATQVFSGNAARLLGIQTMAIT
jgi:aminocarboxymuconate-semialdehyde decarboxylase